MIKHHFSDGVYAKEMHVSAGEIIVSHLHGYDHLSILSKGVVDLDIINEKGVIETVRHVAPSCLVIKKLTHHSIRVIEDAVWYCIHATEETDVEKIDKVLIEKNPDFIAVNELLNGRN